MKRTRVIIMSDIHYCESGWYGVSRDEKANELCADLKCEYERDPYSALLLLGDYSLDHWAWSTKGTYLTRGVSDTRLFRERYLDRLVPEGVEIRMIAGNHEQYGNELWQELQALSAGIILFAGTCSLFSAIPTAVILTPLSIVTVLTAVRTWRI